MCMYCVFFRCDFVPLAKPQITQKVTKMCIFAKVNEQKQIDKINANDFYSSL